MNTFTDKWGTRGNGTWIAGVAVASVSLAAGLVAFRGGTSAYLLLGLLALGLAILLFADHLFACLTAWVAIEGLAFAFVRYPVHHNVFTFDRMTLLAFGGAFLVTNWPRLATEPNTSKQSSTTKESRRLIKAFALFTLVYGVRAFFTESLPPDAYHQATQPLQPELDWLDQWLLPFIVFMVAVRVITRDRWLRLAKAFACLGVSVAAVGLAEWRIGFDLTKFSGFSPFIDPYAGVVRVTGPYSDTVAYGGVLVICIAATVYWMLASRSYVFGTLALAVEVLGLGPSFTKGIWGAGFLALVIALGLRRRRPSRLAVVGMCGATALAITYTLTQTSHAVSTRVTGSNQNIFSRFADWIQGVHIFLHWPVFGAGIEQFIPAQQFVAQVTVAGVPAAFSAHNTFINVLAETGLVGIIPFVFFLYAIVATLRACRRKLQTDEESLFVATIVAATAGYVLLSLTFTAGYYPPTNALLALLLGAGVARLNVGSRSNAAGAPVASAAE